MAKHILAYEGNDCTKDVVIGLCPVNEADQAYWESWDDASAFRSSTRSVQVFYTSVLSSLRNRDLDHYLNPDKYSIYLNFLGAASVMTAWLDGLGSQSWLRGIVLDRHIYHNFGTKCDLPADPNSGLQDSVTHGPAHPPKQACVYPEDSDSCQTCCRDRWFVEPVIAAGLPLIVGEWSLATLTESQDTLTAEFRKKYFKEQLALYAHVGMEGSFFWSFNMEQPNDWKEWALVRIIEKDFAEQAVSNYAWATMCPNSPSQCPDYSDATMEGSLWKATCEWQNLDCTHPVSTTTDEIKSGDTVSLAVSNGKVVYVEGDIARLRCASAGAYQEFVIEKEGGVLGDSIRYSDDVIYLKADAKPWNNNFYYLETDFNPSAEGSTDLVRARSASTTDSGTAQLFHVTPGGGTVTGNMKFGDNINLWKLGWSTKIAGFPGDTVKQFDQTEAENAHCYAEGGCFKVLAVPFA